MYLIRSVSTSFPISLWQLTSALQSSPERGAPSAQKLDPLAVERFIEPFLQVDLEGSHSVLDDGGPQHPFVAVHPETPDLAVEHVDVLVAVVDVGIEHGAELVLGLVPDLVIEAPIPLRAQTEKGPRVTVAEFPFSEGPAGGHAVLIPTHASQGARDRSRRHLNISVHMPFGCDRTASTRSIRGQRRQSLGAVAVRPAMSP